MKLDDTAVDDEGFEELIERQGDVLEEESDFEQDHEDEDVGDDIEQTQLETDAYDNQVIDKTEFKLRNLSMMNKNHETMERGEQQVKNQILMLCSALGGIDPSSNEYILGIDAYGCLKDIKTWLKRFEERNSWLVASFCHDTGLFVNDLVPIMIQLGGGGQATSNDLKIVLISLELMVKLTSPIVIIDDDDNDNEDQLIFYMKMKLAQVEYKYKLLNYNNGQIIKNVLNIAIPILQMDKKDLVKRDNIILNLCITLFVNILRIEPSTTFKSNSNSNKSINVIETIPTGVSRDDISFDKTLKLFEKFNVLTFVQTVSSNLTMEFETSILGYACMDFYYYLYVGIKPEVISSKISAKEPMETSNQENCLSSNGKTLVDLLKTEDTRKKSIFANQATRHANFGTLLKIKDRSNRYRTVSGQSKLLNKDLLNIMDNNTSKETKRLGSNIYREKKSIRDDRLNERTTSVDSNSIKILKSFTNEFIQNSFNTLLKEFDNKILGNPDLDIKDTMVSRFHYLFLINWVLKYQRLSINKQRRSIKDMKSYKFIVYAISTNVIEKLFIVYLQIFQKNYPMLRISVKCIQEIIQCAMDLHSFNKLLDDKNLLQSDKSEIKAYVISAEGTLRNIFKSKDRIKTICDLPKDAQKVSLKQAEMGIEFTNVILKFFKYIKSFKIPLMLIKNPDSDGSGKDDYIAFDSILINSFTNMLLQEKIVTLHIWLFIRWQNFKEDILIQCLTYFSMLLNENWEEHIFKLIRLDFMLALYNLKDSNFSKLTLIGFGKLLDRFMHLFSKLHANTKCVLLEPMTLSSNSNSSILDYYLTGDPFIDSRQKKLDDRFENESRFLDVTFQDGDNMGKSQKISLVITRLLYDDNEEIIRLLIKILTQWVKELKGEVLLDEEKIVRLDSFKLQNDSFKYAKNLPYFRLLCEIVGIKHGRLLDKTIETLEENLALILSAVETPLDQFELENKFNDPNLKSKDGGEYGEDSRGGYYGEGIINDEDSDMNDGDDDLAGVEDLENDPLALLEAQLNTLEKREKGKAVKKSGTGTKKRAKKPSSKEKRASTKRRRKVMINEGDELSDTEIERRRHLSKNLIEDSDDDDEGDTEFFEREMRLQMYLQKKQGKISSDDYAKLKMGYLNVADVSDDEDMNLLEDQQPLSKEVIESESESEDEDESATEDKNGSNNGSESESDNNNDEEATQFGLKRKQRILLSSDNESDNNSEEEEEEEKTRSPSTGIPSEPTGENNSLASTLLNIQSMISKPN